MEMLQETRVQILKELVQRANEGHYTCKRGPRPSGAMIRFPKNADAFAVMGDVKPTAGSLSCVETECMMENNHCVRNIHAEVDALLRAAKNGWATEGATMYSINKPCYHCTLACIKAGIKQIYYAYAVYDEQRTRDALKAAGVECERIDIDG